MQKTTNKTKKKNYSNFIFIIIGVAIGLVMSIFLDGVTYIFGFWGGLLVELLLLVVTYFVQLIIHEAGHLVAGLLSGYGFGSFRIGSLMIVKENEKLKLKKHSVAGTGGQCLMTPPPMNDGDFPVLLYNLGGVLLNLITTLVFVALAVALSHNLILYAFCVMMALSGFIVALTNGIPLKLGMVNNDGSNALELYKGREARMFFHRQFSIVEQISRGKRLCEMDAALFPMPSEEGMKDSISASGAVFLENRLIDEGKLDEALILIDKLLSGENALIGLHKNLLRCDKIAILLIKGERADEIERICSLQEYQVFKKQMKGNISVLRTEYAYCLLYKNDEKLAQEVLSRFEVAAKTHPYASEVEGEREILKRIDEKANI